ncbi:MAG: hypothetical protein FWD62_06115 [Betaproteobacteria bacterium]|nr:hypothetical protein [Betaproteobacteria bacterium]
MAEAAFAVEQTARTEHGRCRPELAVALVSPGSFGTSRADWLATLGDPDLAAWLSEFTPTHLYLGSEFCEHLLLTAPKLKKAIEQAREMDCRVALLTPIASPQVIRNLAKLLPCLPDGSEVIVNDWGVGYFVKQHFAKLGPVGGRLLCRMMKDPRLPAGASTAFSFDPRRSAAMFKRLGMGRMEMDVPIFADEGTFASLPMPTSVHVPFSCVAKGRMCKVGSTGIHGPERFAVGRACKKECLKVSAELQRPAGVGQQTYQLGNTMLSRHSKEMFEIVKAAVAQGFISRIIVPGEAL